MIKEQSQGVIKSIFTGARQNIKNAVKAIINKEIKGGKLFNGYTNADEVFKQLRLGKLSGKQKNFIFKTIFQNTTDTNKLEEYSKILFTNKKWVNKYGKLSETDFIKELKNQGFSDDQAKIISGTWKKEGRTFGSKFAKKLGKLGPLWDRALQGAKVPGIYNVIRGKNVDNRYRRLFNWLFFGTTRTRKEVVSMLRGSKLINMPAIFVTSIGVEVFKRWLFWSIILTFFSASIKLVTDLRTEGKEKTDESTIMRILKRIWEASIFPNFSWIFPAFATWSFINERFGGLIKAIAGGDQNEVEQEFNKVVTTAEEDINSEIANSRKVLDAYAGKNISKHIGENSEESINNGSTKFYLGTPDYPITYVPQIKKWVVEFPDGRIYDIRDIQE